MLIKSPNLQACTAASLPTPPSGEVTLFLNTATGLLSQKDSSGNVTPLSGSSAALGDWDFWHERRFEIAGALTNDNPLPIVLLNSGTVTAVNSTALNGYNPGGILIRSSATANSGVRVQPTTTLATWYFTDTAKKFVINCRVDTSVTFRAGFTNTQSSTAPTNGVFFEALPSNIINFKTSNGGSTTNVALAGGASFVSSPARIEIDVAADASSARCRVWINNGTLLDDQTITTNIPNTPSTYPGLIMTGPAGIADLGVLYNVGYGTVPAFQRATGRT